MTYPPPVRAWLAERFIFNFRMPLDALAEYLPAPWLSPQPVRGSGVASFCLLDLQHIMAAPLPPVVGLHSLNCAPRYAVLDHSGGAATPAVFVTERQTSSAFGAWFTGLGFSSRHPYAPASITHRDPEVDLDVHRPGHKFRLHATVRPAPDAPSELFASAQDFAAFIAQGVTSYGPSRHRNKLTRVDLHKDDRGYEALDVLSLQSPLVDKWRAAGGVLDSAYCTRGGHYEWTYFGLKDTVTP
jgi:hypothetical protein